MNTELRDKTVEYLAYLRETGESHITLGAATWEALQQAQVKSVTGASPALNRAVPERVSASTPSRPVQPVRDLPRHAAPLGSAEKIKALEDLAAMIRDCPRCAALFRRKKNMVFGVGNPDAEIMFVGEAPGAEEDEAGEPFVGKAGQLLTKMIEAMGLSREKVYISNVVKYRPDMPPGSMGNRKPTLEEVEVSRPYLRSQIEIIRPKVIVSLGATALEGLLSLEKSAITRMRGNWMSYEDIPLMPTFHPAYLLRNPTNEEKRKVWEDLLQVMEKTGLPISEKQRGFFLKK